MSDNRSAALAGALQLVAANGKPETPEYVLTTAQALLSFLDGTDVTKPAPAGKPTAATKPTTTKPAGTKKKTEDEAIRDALEAQKAADAEADAEVDAEDEADAEVDAEPADEFPATKEGAQAVIAKLLQANKRKQAISLLKKFNAASATSIKEKDYVKFVAAAKAELAKSAEPAEEDLTA